ncbi:MAG: hypothetical protein GY948_00320 [Alphaproteobacteria bacterium]|nr:hypothetical protein [Alphaproteobacteria bacterium]
MAIDTRALLQKPMADPVRLQKSLQKFGIPRSLRDRIVVGTKTVLAPGEEAKRKQQITKIAKPKSTAIEDFKINGSGLLASEHLPEAQPATTAMHAFYTQLDAAGRVQKPADQRKAEFLVRLASNEEIMEIKPVREFVLSDELIGLASHYFGQVPVLSRADLWWSPPNESKAESQLYHYDGEDKSQLKIILNVVDVDENTGPFTFLPAGASEKIGRNRRHSARLDDDAVEETMGREAVTRLTGPASTVGAVDTSRCLHYGSRGNSRDRLILMLQFTRFLAPKASLPNWNLNAMGVGSEDLDQTRKMVLNMV